MRAQICRTFGWRLDELDEMPADDVLRSWRALVRYEEYRQKRMSQLLRSKES